MYTYLTTISNLLFQHERMRDFGPDCPGIGQGRGFLGFRGIEISFVFCVPVQMGEMVDVAAGEADEGFVVCRIGWLESWGMTELNRIE